MSEVSTGYYSMICLNYESDTSRDCLAQPSERSIQPRIQ